MLTSARKTDVAVSFLTHDCSGCSLMRHSSQFACHLASCSRLFLTPKARRLHLIQGHGYPKEYFFAVTNKGVGGLLKKWGEGASMIRGQWRSRDQEKMDQDSDSQSEDSDTETVAGPGMHAGPRLPIDEDTEEDTPAKQPDDAVQGLTAFVPSIFAAPSRTETAKRATCTVDSAEVAADLSGCSSVELTSFTVPNDKGTNVQFNGNGMMFNGNGADYWDGLGTNGGKPKPHPFIAIEASGTFENFVAYNTPAQAIRVQPAADIGPLIIDGVYVNNAAGDADELGHNTDGFDVRGTDITIQNSIVENQDDCIAINDGSNILFQNNVCSGGHGMSIGSIATGDFVTGVVFSHNTVSNSMYGTRVKAQSAATTGAVSNVTWTGNTISGATKYGVLITQSYPDDDGTPGVDTPFSDVNFVGDPTSVTVVENAHRVTVDCGNCAGTWDFSGLTVGGGLAGTIVTGDATIQGGSF
ncbi:hypothetical protein EVJ58_g1725 [Rhodofomes roseus]|uniref:endo-polygalacturonase n=1 Tax=Rhodofomes roseus TaxID=34475 RepID=A0A4Y9Z0A3_9APHY|nr:hypothetical protein EVJ58_g1725 [Rhodofomes roseus]